MKKKIAIIALLVVAELMAFYLKSHAQTESPGYAEGGIRSVQYTKDTISIAEGTTLNYTKTEAKIQCNNESVFNSIFKTHGTLFKRFTCTWKTDRYGKYKYYVIYLSQGDADIIFNWAKTNL